MKKALITGGIFAMLAVALGAFGAHALKATLGDYQPTYETGIQYQMLHAVAILISGILLEKTGSGFFTAACWCFSLGIIVFSGSLYVLSITKITILGAITPIGGVLFIVGWLLFIIGSTKERSMFARF
ncbi:DUF423 domain-containing protein [Listeria ilorinensis]|uniref:DUF423 domain-containing protein n=1 Tax=Listeria ilorinensis TaxID=2867439 RepID=UPI001EF4FF64|nr:DUF423 domain-containing protein [Listeria ilorinensis]